MKKIILVFVFLCSLKSFSQDSVKIQVVQVSDIEYFAAFFSMDKEEDFFDGVKSKFRVANPPVDSATLVVIDSMFITDWLRIIKIMKTDQVALKANCTSRVETILRAVGNTYLNNQLDAYDAILAVTYYNIFNNTRQSGKVRLTKKNN